jgi:type I restriction enzyme S subunit
MGIWTTIKISELADKNIENSFVDGDWIESEHIINEGIRIIQTGNIGIGRYLDKSDSKKFISTNSFSQLKCKKVFPGDLLICRLADPIGRCCIVPNVEEYYVTAVDVVILRPESNHFKKFLLYYLNDAKVLKAANDKAAGSTRQRVSRTNYGNIEISIPPYPEQTRIAEILSTADKAIEQTEKLIAKYKRIKTGLMHDLLTYGIDEHGNIRSKATHKFVIKKGIEVPEEWEVSELIDLCADKRNGIQTGPFGAQLHARDYVEEGIPLILIRNIVDGKIIEKDIPKITIQKANELKRYRIKKDDIIFSRVGDVGRVSIAEEKHNGWLISGQMLRARLENPNIDIRFLKYLIQTFEFKQRLKKEILGTTRESINTKILEELLISIPKKDEQKEISDTL